MAGVAVAQHASDVAPLEPPPEAERSESGLVSLRLEKGYNDQKPDANDYVAMHYTLWTPSGGQIETSQGKNVPVNVLMEKLAPGWLEGLQLMTGGEKRRLWIPANLAPQNSKKGPKGAVICDIELLGVRSIPDLSPRHMRPPPDAHKTRFGALTSVVEAGEGTEKASSGVGALVNYTMWTAVDGRVFDSTIMRDRPTFFPYEKVMPAFADVLKLMVVGEKRLIWIPANVANGQWVGSPNGPLIFEAELLQIMDQEALDAAGVNLEAGAPPPQGG